LLINISTKREFDKERTNHTLVKCSINHEGRVLVIGGESKSGQLLDSIEIFDGKKWSNWIQLPEARCGLSSVFVPFYINKYFIDW
jgi:N-acetylneuraminic acid mutarotase